MGIMVYSVKMEASVMPSFQDSIKPIPKLLVALQITLDILREKRFSLRLLQKRKLLTYTDSADPIPLDFQIRNLNFF